MYFIVSGKNNKNGRAIISTLFMKRSLSFQSEFISAQCILIFLLLILWHLKSNYWVWTSGWSGIRYPSSSSSLLKSKALSVTKVQQKHTVS